MKSLSFLILVFLLFFVKNSSVASKKINPVLLVSLDGFRADKFDDFLAKNPNANFNKFINEGVKADFMKPSFPSLTFPNHWTLVTGLYPESHGIIENRFYDPVKDVRINLLGGENSLDPYWWNVTDPIWLTARKQGLKTGCSFWPGSEVWPRTPDIFLPFDKKYEVNLRIEEVVDWFDKFDLDFATFYFDQPDSTGHSYGPDSNEYYDMLVSVDEIMGHLFQELKNKNLYDKINIIILSDHGMAAMPSKANNIYLYDYIDKNLVDANKTFCSKVSNIYPISDNLENELLTRIQNNVPNVKAYLKSEVPEEFHYNTSQKIGPIVVVADEGYALTDSTDPWYKPGQHGYNNSLISMRTIFTARGPDFAMNKQLNSFENVNVYPVICNLLNINCHSSNGSLENVKGLFKSSQGRVHANLGIILSSLIFLRFF